AGIDLALALVRQHHGAQTAVAVAKRLVVVAQRQGGQSQFSPYVNAPSNADSPVAGLQSYVMAHIGQRHTRGGFFARKLEATRADHAAVDGQAATYFEWPRYAFIAIDQPLVRRGRPTTDAAYGVGLQRCDQEPGRRRLWRDAATARSGRADAG